MEHVTSMRRIAFVLALLVGASAQAREIQQQDNDANGFRIYNPHAPTQSTDVVRNQDVAPGLCIDKSPGVNTLPLVCAADGFDYLSPTTGIAVAGHAALSVIGRSVNTTGADADIAGTNGQFLGISSSTLAFQTMTAANSGVVATWSLTGVQVFCLDTTAGNDANAGTAFSADLTQGNVSTATAACGAVAKKTLAGLVAIIPPNLADRLALVVVNNPNGNSGVVIAENLMLLDAPKAATNFIVRATGTNTTAGAVAFSGSTADLTYAGAMTGTGMNASGYNPAGNVTSDTVQLVKVGGGSPTFAAEPAKPLGLRFRCDSATTTTADRNKVWMIVERTAADTIRLDSSATFVSSDVCYIEQPGVVFTPSPAATASFSGGNFSMSFSGIGTGAAWNVVGGRYTFAFCSTATSMVTLIPISYSFTPLMQLSPNPTIGPTRIETSFAATGGSPNFSANSFVSGTTWQVNEPTTLSFLTHNVVGTNATIFGGATPSQQLPGSQQFGATGGNGTTTDKANAARVLGQLIFRGAHVSVGVVNFPIAKANHIVHYGTNDIAYQYAIFGATATDAVIDISQSTMSRVQLTPSVNDVNNSFQVTGTNGDVYGGTTPTIGSINVYATFLGLTQNQGVMILPNGDQWTSTRGTSFTSSQSYSYSSTVSTAVYAHNRSGADIPVNANGCGLLVRFGPNGLIGTDRMEIAIAQADSLAHASGGIGQAVGIIKNNTAGYVVITAGAFTFTGSDAFSGGLGQGLLWLSDTVAGEVTHSPPVPPSVALRIGWAIGEAQAVLMPDNEPLDATLTTGTGVVGRAAISGDASIPAGSNTLTLATVVSAASCTYCSTTFDAKGRATAFSSGAAPALATRNLTAGAGMTGGGDLTADRTFDVVANADGTMVVNANDIQVGVINTANIAGHAVTNAKIRQGVATSVIGVTGLSTADEADIQATASGQCLQTNGGGNVVWAACPASGGSGTVTTVTGSDPIFITSTPTTTPNVTIQGALTSGSTSTSAQSLGALNNGTLQQTISAGVATLTAFNGTAANVPYYTTSGQLAQDANHAWDGTNHVLEVGGSTGLAGQRVNVLGTQTLASATSLTWDAVYIDPGTLTLTGTTHITTATGLNGVTIKAPTITDGSAATVDNAATFAVIGGPGASGSATVTNKYNSWFEGGQVRIDAALDLTGVPTIPQGALRLEDVNGPIQVFTQNGTLAGGFVVNTAQMSIHAASFHFYKSATAQTGPSAVIGGNGLRLSTGVADATTTNALLQIDGNASNLAVYLNGAFMQQLFKHGGDFQFGTDDSNKILIQTNATTAMTITSAQHVQVADLTAGGIVKATAATGQLGVAAHPADYLSEADMPSGSRVLFSGGTSSAPLGDAAFTWDNTVHGLSIGGGFLFGGGNRLDVLPLSTLDLSGIGGASARHDAILLENQTTSLTNPQHVTTANGFNTAAFYQETYTAGSAMTIDKAATAFFKGPPIGGTNVTITTPYTVHVGSGLTQLDGAVGINGVSVASNQMLVAGATTEGNRDSASFFLGGGTLSTGGDYFHLFTSTPSLPNGSYATLRTVSIDQMTYNSSGTATVNGEMSSLFVAGKPLFGTGGFVNNGFQVVAHFGDGIVQIDGDSTFGYTNGPRVFTLPNNTSHSPAGGSPTMVVDVFIPGVGEKFLYLYDH